MSIFNKTLATFLMMACLTAEAAQMDNLRNQRYCEIILSQKSLNFSVYNTIGLNDCPQQIWEKITPESIKKETGAFWVHLNGPRYWMIDGFKNTKAINPEQRVLGGLAMREAGIVHLGLFDILRGGKPYSAITVDRETVWVFDANKPVYELIDPKGQVFVMQSYSVQKAPQTEESLAQLGSKLKLPEGWKFRTGTLRKEMDLVAVNNKATVVQDDFLNTYQLAAQDFLN